MKDPSKHDDSTKGSEGAGAPSRVGGCAFYLSLFVLIPTSLLFLLLTLPRIIDADSFIISLFVAGGVVGAMIAHFAIRKHISVLIHEFKHSLVSNFVGNRHKGLEVFEDSGKYEYTYTKDTAHYNALISLAPYIVPVFTLLSLGLGALLTRGNSEIFVALVGVGYGIDLVLNVRDISPVQTDISEIRGGYWVGILYIVAWNLMIAALLLAWVFHGIEGLTLLLDDLAFLLLYLRGPLTGNPEQ